MPVLIDRGSNPWRPPSPGTIEVGLLNNMPDAALEATERQFAALLQPAAENVTVRLRRFSLPGIARGERAQRHLDTCYAGIDELWDTPLDALIVTGTEPRAPALQDEPYWSALTEVVDWASNNTVSTIWSCLAAHAAAAHLDGVERRPLDGKLFGVFECDKASDHPLVDGGPSRWCVPHSRCNELPEEALVRAGYRILTRSPEVGADMFIKERDSLFLFLQGHPEYDSTALFGEYRRDIRRFLAGDNDCYPELPHGYFNREAVEVMLEFRERALRERDITLLPSFPAAEAGRQLAAPWRSMATQLYANWLSYLAERRAAPAPPHRTARIHEKRPAPLPV